MTTKIDIRRLRDVNELAKAGAETVAQHLNQLTGVETQMQITKINVIDVEDLGRHLGHDKMVGVNVPLKESPHGSVLILFDDDSAKTLAHTMVGSESSGGPGYSEMERSAIREVGNIMTSGFIDGWANVLGRTIDISTPQLLRAGGDDIVDPAVALDLDEQSTGRRIVVLSEFDRTGLLIDDVHQVLDVEDEEVDTSNASESTHGVVRRDDRFVVWVEPAAIV